MAKKNYTDEDVERAIRECIANDNYTPKGISQATGFSTSVIRRVASDKDIREVRSQKNPPVDKFIAEREENRRLEREYIDGLIEDLVSKYMK